MVTRQCVGLSSDAVLLLVQELWWRRRQECHVVHSAHWLHFVRGDKLGGGERAVTRHGLSLKGAVKVLQEVRLEREGAGPG